MAKPSELKKWATIFRGLGNQNRLHILQLLDRNGPMSVTELSDELEISFKNTSRNLGILGALDFVEFEGRKDRVYYSLSTRLTGEIKKLLRVTKIIKEL